MTMQDTDVAALINAEEARQDESLELIPSENYASVDVREAQASVFTNKYSEGYPGKRYYGGQDNTDPLEQLAIDRAKSLFRGDHANVQPHSGAQANEAVYHAWADHGDTILAMDLSHGGHLTHGAPVTVLSKQFRFVRYVSHPDRADHLDYDEIAEIAHREKPKIIVAGYSGYPRLLDYSRFADIARSVDALAVADIAHIAGLIAGNVLPNPLDNGFHVLTSTTHKSLRGPRGGMIISKGTVSSPLRAPEKTLENIPTLIDRAVFPGIQGGPMMHTIAAKAVCLHEAMQPGFSLYAQQILSNATALADSLAARGFVLVTGGTDNHLILVDMMASFGIDGADAEVLFDTVGLTMNKNSIPGDTLPPYRPSGVRLGTPALTTRGMKELEMTVIAGVMADAIQMRNNPSEIQHLREVVRELARKFPVPASFY
jgi:glycine hydroxymethyltransferase